MSAKFNCNCCYYSLRWESEELLEDNLAILKLLNPGVIDYNGPESLWGDVIGGLRVEVVLLCYYWAFVCKVLVNDYFNGIYFFSPL